MRSFARRWVSACLPMLAALVIFASHCAALAADESTPPIALDDPQSKAAVREMVATLSDDAVRALLIQRLDAVAEAHERAEGGASSALQVVQDGFANLADHAKTAVLQSPTIPSLLGKATDVVAASMAPRGGGFFFLVLAGALVAGLLAERCVALFFRKRKLALIDAVDTTLSGILKTLYTRLSFDIFGVLAFAITSYLVVASVYQDGTHANTFGYAIIATISSAWLGYVISRFYFAPRRPDLRICRTTDERALQITISFALLAGFIVLIHNSFYLLYSVATEIFGNWDPMAPVGFFLNLSIYTAAIAVILYNRAGLTEVLMENKKRVYLAIGEDVSDDLSWFAVNWPTIAIALIVLKYLLVEIVVNSAGVGVYSTGAVYITFIVIFLWPSIDALVSLFVARGITTPEDETEAAGKARRGMQQGLLRVGRVFVVCVVLYALASLWGLNILSLAEAGLGAKVAGRVVEIVFIGLIAYILLELVSIVIGRWLAAEGGLPDENQEEMGGGDAGGVGLSRVATLLPIFRRTLQFTIVGISIIMVLNNWGLNIGPILAGAGVVGLAIGFGAQTLVKDIVSGLFFLVDDAFRVGEYIDVGGTMGTVEKISLRSLRLRHHKGLVHTIPYGEIPKLTNFSRDWVIMKLRFRVPFDVDVNKVKKIFKKIGNELLDDPELGEDFLQPFKSQGVAEVDDNGLVIRGKFMAKPGKQFMIRKEVYVRVQKAFDEAGIPFARKQVMVHIPGLDKDDQLTASDVKAVAAAAAEAADEPMATGSPRPANA